MIACARSRRLEQTIAVDRWRHRTLASVGMLLPTADSASDSREFGIAFGITR
jgi:hypothetical protein